MISGHKYRVDFYAVVYFFPINIFGFMSVISKNRNSFKLMTFLFYIFDDY